VNLGLSPVFICLDCADKCAVDGIYRLFFAANLRHYNHEDAMFAHRGSMLGEVNDFRAATGESLLKPSATLTPAAEIHSAAGALHTEMAD